tara:strand:+ start:1344 stop:2972 length:1629 start_codon:yes stop_codon:yes gene_type:complete
MTGAVLDLLAHSSSENKENNILIGNPKITQFKSSYKKHTPFSMQKFRIDHNKLRHLQENLSTKIEFEIPRNGDLLNDIYLVVTLPNIYSSFHYRNSDYDKTKPYEFKWIKEIGVQMIKKISIRADGITIQEYDGEYLSIIKERDYSYEKKQKWNKMVGNVNQLTDPASYIVNFFKNDKNVSQFGINDLSSCYPNVLYSNTVSDSDYMPSIQSRTLYIPLETFFCQTSKHSLPLIALQYQKITIDIEFRPLRELYIIKDSSGENIQPKKNNTTYSLYNFLQPPKNTPDHLNVSIDNWNNDIHLMGNYIFLDKSERTYFAKNSHTFLYKEIITREEFSICETNSVNLKHCGLTSSFIWRFRRDDSYLRNEWCNYSNWKYEDKFPLDLSFNNGSLILPTDASQISIKDILESFAILYNGKYREIDHADGIYNHLEQFRKSSGNMKDGIYTYNYCLNTNRDHYQPTGGSNLLPFKDIYFEFTTLEPPRNTEISSTNTIVCDGDDNIAFINKDNRHIFEYTYDLKIYEERYNLITIKNGILSLLHAK